MKNNLKPIREKLGFMQKEVAEKLHITASRLSLWEKGSREPDIKNAIALADLYNTTVKELFPNLNA